MSFQFENVDIAFPYSFTFTVFSDRNNLQESGVALMNLFNGLA